MRLDGFKRSNPNKLKFNSEQIDNMCKLYEEGKTSKEIAQLYNTNGERILKYLRMRSVKLRPSQAEFHKRLSKEGKLSIYLSAKSQGVTVEEWKGFISPEANRVRHSVEYKDWRIKVFIRDNTSCVICKSKTKLQAHHIYPVGRYPSLVFSVNNGITLCYSCHSCLWGKEENHVEYFKSLINSDLNPEGDNKEYPQYTPIINVVDTKDLINDYRNGVTLAELSRKYPMTRTGIKRRLQTSGIKFEHPIKL
jgi:hypothetical protein